MPLPQYDNAVDFEQAQPRLKRVFNVLLKIPLLDGVLLSDVELAAATDVPVVHGLGRKPLGYFPVALSAEISPYEYAARDDKFLYLRSASGGTVALWVF
jgi:hypothetical protein